MRTGLCSLGGLALIPLVDLAFQESDVQEAPDAADAQEAAAGEARPCIVWIVSDDQGIGDVGMSSKGASVTPALDRLAAEGVRFTRGYASAASCAPSRAGLLTGRYQRRFGFNRNLDRDIGLPDAEVTIAERLREDGYRTGLIGKWHLGTEEGSHPLDQGFEEFYGFLGGAHSYTRLAIEDEPDNPLMRGREPVDDAGYLTDRLTEEALAFVERHADEPFFLLLSYNAPHFPLEPPPDAPSATRSTPGRMSPEQRRAVYFDVVARMDRGIGALCAKLEEADLAANTLLFFVSDNGGATSKGASNGPLRGGKFRFTEGGLRVPFLARWPGRFPAGTEFGELASTLDLFQTSIVAAGLTGSSDGTNLRPLLEGDKGGQARRPALHFSNGLSWAVIEARWKLLFDNGRLDLFDLLDDPGEEVSRNATERETIERMTAMHERWLKRTRPGKGR